ncbi:MULTISPECIES: hypothetical protein [Paraburkholderia]|uniref:Uncharacterized protein n=1 Tax=Paraburkholderia youngii TaxID=2782701 RepID=A0A7Y6MZ98_9BURK|nr:hypothetical protein [Paraburkholderia youngii]NUX99790.1 hypothetical protein [Paraburkholderia youngii]
MSTMNSIQMNPQRYIAILSEYDAILAHARAMSDRLAGRCVSEKHLSYAETIFTKLLCHACSLQKLGPMLQPTSGPELWDIGAACVLARTLIEAFDALTYVSLHPVPPVERELRILAWELHDLTDHSTARRMLRSMPVTRHLSAAGPFPTDSARSASALRHSAI